MEWFRHYHGLASDPKLTSVSLTAEVHHCIAVAAWCFVLEHASSSSARGNVSDLSPKVMAIGLRIGKSEAERLLAAFAEEGLILSDGSVKAWEKRQRRSDTSAERVRKWREKRVTEAGVTNSETPQGGDVTLRPTSGNVTSDARTEQNREDSTPVRGAGAPEMAKAALWREMKSQIGGTNPGSLVGKWVKAHGLPAVTEAHFAAMASPPADYVEWMTKRLQANGRPYAVRTSRAGKSYHDYVTESLTDEPDQGFEALPRMFGEASILCPSRADYDS